MMKKIHNVKERMPLIFTEQTANEWLPPSLSDSDIKNLMQLLDKTLMNAYTTAKITSRSINPIDVNIIKPFEYPELKNTEV
jgi:putative SOS response-associated peptidase YedK